MKIEGGCLCGKVRYSADTEPGFVSVCHSKNCQKQAGTAFSVGLGIRKQALSVHGTLRTFQDRGGSGSAVYRKFCPECGSPILSEVEARPEIAFIRAGTLDDTSWIEPNIEIFCDSAQPWVTLGGERRRFSKMPG